MLLGASTFLSQVDLLRTVAVTGPKGSGKDLLCMELAEFYLQQGYKFSSNQRCVWNDELFYIRRLSDSEIDVVRSNYRVDDRGDLVARRIVDNSWFRDVLGAAEISDKEVWVKVKDVERVDVMARYGKDEIGYFERVPDTNHMVLDLTEAGRYFRKWVYFENLYEFTRKTDNYIFMPSIRLPHVDLCEMICVNVFTLKDVIGYPAGVWSWSVSGGGLLKSIGGMFAFIPTKIGLYDTHDLSTSPTETIEWFTRNLDRLQKAKGRHGFSDMESQSSALDADGVDTLTRQIEGAALSIQNKGKKR